MNTWYVYKNGHQYGPFADTDLIGWTHAGYLAPHDLVWRSGMDTWSQASKVPGLFPGTPQPPSYQPLASVTTPSMTPSAPAGTTPVVAPTQRRRSQGAPQGGEGRFRGSLLLFILATTLVLLVLAWVFTQGDEEDALVLWTWIAALLIGLFGLGLPLVILFSGHRTA